MSMMSGTHALRQEKDVDDECHALTQEKDVDDECHSCTDTGTACR